MSTTRLIPRHSVRRWAGRWPCNGFPDAGLQYAVDGGGDLLDYAWVTVHESENSLRPVTEPKGVDGHAISALIDDAQGGAVVSVEPGLLGVL